MVSSLEFSRLSKLPEGRVRPCDSSGSTKEKPQERNSRAVNRRKTEERERERGEGWDKKPAVGWPRKGGEAKMGKRGWTISGVRRCEPRKRNQRRAVSLGVISRRRKPRRVIGATVHWTFPYADLPEIDRAIGW